MKTAAVHPPAERVDVFIDALNLYQGLMAKRLRDALWLDLRAMSEVLLVPGQSLGAVFYFTASRTVPPESYARQQTYFRALDARGGVERIEGKFDRRKAPCVHCGRMTEMPRERATDVNLASVMVHRAARDDYDVALLLSGDADYVMPIECVQDLGKRVKVARPPGRRSDELAAAADYMTDIRPRDVRARLLPDPVTPVKGAPIPCPFEWLSIEQKISRLSDGHRRTLETVLETVGHSRRHLLHNLADEYRRAERGQH